MLNLNDDQRQSLTTWSMIIGAGVFTFLTAIMVWILRWSWPRELLPQLAPKILDHLAWLAFGLLALVGVMVVAMATIAIGGQMKAKIGVMELSGESEEAVKNRLSPPNEGETL